MRALWLRPAAGRSRGGTPTGFVPEWASATTRKSLKCKHSEVSNNRHQYITVYEVGSQAPFRHLMAFSFRARTVHAHDPASCCRVPALSGLASFLPRRSPPAALPSPAAGGERLPL